jgi:hypothetical protein
VSTLASIALALLIVILAVPALLIVLYVGMGVVGLVMLSGRALRRPR